MKRHQRPTPARDAILGASWVLIIILLFALVGVLAASGWVR